MGQLLRAVVLGVHPTVHAASQTHKAALGGSITALYHPLDRVETRVAAALGRAAAALAEPVGNALRARPPPWFPGDPITVLAGNHWSATEQRRKAWHGPGAAPRPGQALVVLDQQRLWIPHVGLSEDGQAQERRLRAPVLQHVAADHRWIAARHFCPLGLMVAMARGGPPAGAVNTARARARSAGVPPARAPPGVVWSLHQPCACETPASGEAKRGRRRTRTLKAPTRAGDPDLHLVPVHRASAPHLARLYGKRWRIETAFFARTTTLACEINTLGYPKAALFACCLALVAYNAVALIKAARRSLHGRPKSNDEVANYDLA